MDLHNTFSSSDHHFGHKFCVESKLRDFQSVEEMDEALIAKHNAIVRSDSVCILVGDLSFHNGPKTRQLLQRMNGRLYLVPGNHDTFLWKDKSIADRFENAALLREMVKRPDGFKFNISLEMNYEQEDGNQNLIVFSHYCSLLWRNSHRGSLMLHGHSHNSMRYPYPMRAMDVGVDAHSYQPVKLADVVCALEKIEPHQADYHKVSTK